jgi:hypothetical protein
MKSTARHQQTVVTSSSSSEDDLSLGADHEEASTPTCEQLINILLILFNFRFTNIEVAWTITSAFKSSMEIPLFQWSQVSKLPEWRPNIDPWFRRFQVSVNF